LIVDINHSEKRDDMKVICVMQLVLDFLLLADSFKQCFEIDHQPIFERLGKKHVDWQIVRVSLGA
jgi:hypothetical protein